MDDQIERVILKKIQDTRSVTNIQIEGMKVFRDRSETAEIPGRVSLGAEEVGSHIVIYSEYFGGSPVEILHHFGSDEAAGSCHQNSLSRAFSGGMQTRIVPITCCSDK
jgi:hypothetical protein